MVSDFSFFNRKDCNFVNLEVLDKCIPVGRVCVHINCFTKMGFVLIRAFNLGIVLEKPFKIFSVKVIFPFLD